MSRRLEGFSGTQPTPSFGFGTQQTGTSTFGFGNVTKTAGTAFPTFGMTTSAPSFGNTPGFSFGTLGTSTTPASGFSFGSATTTPSFSFGGLGATTTTTPGFSFGGLGSTSTAPSNFSFGGLGSSTTAPALGTGFGFGQTGSLGTGTTGLGFGTIGGTSALGTLTAPVPGQEVNTVTNIAMALSFPIVYGDERDVILTKWNQLQAFWGVGKGYFSNNAPPVEFTPENPFCRFKAIGYNCLPPWKQEDGLVALTFNKQEADIRNHQQQMVDSLHKLFGSKPTISVFVEGIKSQPDDKTEVIIYLVERPAVGVSRRVLTTEVIAYLEQPMIKTQLASMDVVSFISKAAPNKEQLKQYLDNPPAGIDTLLWNQAKLDNPNPEQLIPVPIIGFSELKRRLKYQEHETKQQQERLDIIAEDISELRRRHATTLAKISEYKRKQVNLGHKVLKIMAKQEVIRKFGYAIQADEEQLRVQLEAIQAELNAPTQFKGRLRELLSQIRMQNQVGAIRGEAERYVLDETLQEDIKVHLLHQQEGVSHLLRILKDDLEDLKIIDEGLVESADHRR